jgi:Serine dehydrogenase proteinase
MPTWGELGDELQTIHARVAQEQNPKIGPFDILRRKYLARLHERTGRATFLYYSGWMDKPQAGPETLSVVGADVCGFMEACSNAISKDDRKLDLFVHSPGGDADAAEQICEYLRTQYDHIRVIVPLQAMSAATMMALSADEVVMGDHSQLGPIDPQLTIQTPEGPRQASAQAIKDQFDLAQKQCADPEALPAWMPILRTFAPGLLAACDHAAARAEEIVSKAMAKYMLAGDPEASEKAAEAASWFGDAKTLLSHGRPVRRDEAREHGVKVVDLEADDELQDAILSVHHATMHTMAGTPAAKLIENENGRAYFLMTHPVQLQVPLQGQQQGPGQEPKPPPKPPRKQGKKRR